MQPRLRPRPRPRLAVRIYKVKPPGNLKDR